MHQFWIRDMFLDHAVLADLSLLREVFETIRRELTYGLSSVRIDWLNGVATDSSTNRGLLSILWYVVHDGMCVLDLA